MFLDGCFSPQLRPEANSIWEDGRLYELAVESTVPVPCPGVVAPPAGGHCALTLELATSGEGEGGRLGTGSSQSRFLTVSVLLSSPVEGRGGLQEADVSLSSCLVHLPQVPCGDGVCSRALVHFSPVTDFVSDGNRTTRISAAPISSQSFLWNGYSPEPAEVNPTNLQACNSLNSPVGQSS